MEEEEKKQEDVLEKVEDKINELISVEGVKKENIDYLYKLIDVKKDLKNIEFWKEEENKMRYYGDNEYSKDFSGYGNYNEYGRRGMRGTGPYSRYNGGRGSGRYRGEESFDDMRESYRDYREASNSYNAGNYGAEQDTMKSLDYMLKSVHQFLKMLKEDANNEEEMQLIKQYTRKMSEM